MPLSLRWFFIRLVAGIAIFHGAWELGSLDRYVIQALHYLINGLAPLVFSHVSGVLLDPDGRWRLITTISAVEIRGATLNIDVAYAFSRKAVSWIPTALALICASGSQNLRRLLFAVLAIAVSAVIMMLVGIAAHLAIVANSTPSMYINWLPNPPTFETSATPYPAWYFRLITFAVHLKFTVSSLAMPVIVWGIVCFRDWAAMFRTHSLNDSQRPSRWPPS